MREFRVLIEDLHGCDASLQLDLDLRSALLANMRSAAFVAMDAVRDSTNHHTVLVQVEDPQSGERVVVEIIVSAIVTRLASLAN